MVPNKPITNPADSRWLWLLNFWRMRREFIELSSSLRKAQDENHLLTVELNDLKAKVAASESDHQIARDGNRALLQFIHRAHRLRVKFDENSIRSALKRGNGK